MKLIFWGKYLDTYLTDTLARFESLTAGSIHYVLVEERFTRREGTGAQHGTHAGSQTILDKRGFQQQVKHILEENGDALHLFLSFWGDKRLFAVLLRALAQKIRVAVIFEPYTEIPVGYWKDEGWLGSVLKVLTRKVAYRALWPLLQIAARGELLCVLAVSPLAEDQLRRVGFPKQVIYPYAYFVEKKVVDANSKNTEEGALQVVFSGSLIKRKGLDVALAAVRQANRAKLTIRLDVYGAGVVDQQAIERTAGARYCGTYPQFEAQQVLSGYQLLLVPSRHEGWGLVVNEALMQGVPVVASDRVGAGCLIESSGAGMIFKSEMVDDLVKVLEKLAKDSFELVRITKACKELDGKITPTAGAEYMMRVFEYHFSHLGERPIPGWLNLS